MGSTSTVFTQNMNSAEILLALKKLRVLGSALYIAAHPDDENTNLLAYLSKERLVRTGYLSLTRGDGGQNLIGTETNELLGVLRTQELLAARRIDSAEQFFSRAIDFGYSKNPEETLQIWEQEKILGDIIWIIRFRFHPGRTAGVLLLLLQQNYLSLINCHRLSGSLPFRLDT